MDVWFGPYKLIRELEPARISPVGVASSQVRRWAAVHERDDTGHLVYSLGPARDRFAKKRFLSAAEGLAALKQAHLLTADAYALSDRLGACLVAAYPGHHAGVVTLDELLEHKGGRLNGAEAVRAAAHLLEGIAAVHQAGFSDGALGADRVHVDPRGSLLIEMPTFWAALCGRREASPDRVRADVRRIVEMTLGMIAGPLPRGGLAGDIDPRWAGWLSRGLDPAEGFSGAEEAMAALPKTAAVAGEPKPGLVRSLLDRIRASLPIL